MTKAQQPYLHLKRRDRHTIRSDAACVYSLQKRKSQCSRGSLGSWINIGAMMRQ